MVFPVVSQISQLQTQMAATAQNSQNKGPRTPRLKAENTRLHYISIENVVD